jgi:hypothetical protein
MKLWILDLAEADLLRGFRFYERKSRGVGWYFLDSLSAEIESLHLYAGVHRKYLGYLIRLPLLAQCNVCALISNITDFFQC